jgi:para-nitrobenzyl esterase
MSAPVIPAEAVPAVAIPAVAATGTYRGSRFGETAVFKGIRYATADRFQPPVAVPPSTTAISADTYGGQAPQLLSPIEQMLGAGELAMTEDCHFLNIYTPAADDRLRPVLVWIHGGAFTTGSGAMPWYHGSSLAARGNVVVVTVNYRLGALGFTDLGSLAGEKFADAGNLGLLDQLAALRWVAGNIAAFGGNPDDVTVFGESAGGASVVALLGTPAADGLFHKGLAMSPSLTQLRTADRAAEAAEQLLAAANVDIDGLLTLPVDQILTAQAVLLGNFTTAFTAFSPTPGGTLFECHPLTAAAANPVPLVIGTNRDEMLLYAQFDPETRNLDAAALHQRAVRLFGESRAVRAVQLYDRFRDHDTPARLAAAMVTDETFRAPAWRLAQSRLDHRHPTWMYWFTWPTPAFGGGLGACHAVDLPFTFHNLDGLGVDLFTGTSTDRTKVADAVSGAVLAYARHGHPGWPLYDAGTRATRRFDVDSTLLTDPEAELRRLWLDLGDPPQG